MKKAVLSALILLVGLMCLPIAALAADRFVDNNNGTVTDTRTGLIWLKYANLGNEQTWNNAVPNCSSLASGQAFLTDGSSAGQWRLPSKEELEGIGTDPPATWESGYPPVTWTMPGAPFTNVKSGYYWSGTSYGDVTTDGAWKVYMSNGLVDTSFKSDNCYVWPVRVGDNVPVDECAQKIPLPKTVEDFMHEEILPSPVLGNNPEEISPIGFGDIATGGSTVTFRIDICPFEGPMAFFLWYEYYALDANNKVTTFFTPSEKPEDILWKNNVTDSIQQEIPGDFGGLFPDAQHLPKGNNFFHLMVIPTEGNMDFTAYEWTYVLTIKCEDYIRQPEGKQKFHIKPAAMPLTGTDPEKIQPFAIGPYALGGDVLDMRVDFCAFEPFETFAESTDIHFGIYCPSEDLFNIYFVNGEAKTEQDLFQKVSSIKFLFSPELPPIAYSDKNLFENEQEGAVRFFGGKTSELPKKRCYYIAAVTPRGVRDKFYAWILPLDVNIKNAMAEYLLNKN